MPGWLDQLGVKTVDEAVIKLKPMLDDAENRMRDIVRENVERLNGATFDLRILDGKIQVTTNLQPVAPPAVPND